MTSFFEQSTDQSRVKAAIVANYWLDGPNPIEETALQFTWRPQQPAGSAAR